MGREGEGERLKIKIKTPWSLKEALREFNDLSLAESYIYGLMDLEGDIFTLLPLVDWIIEKRMGVNYSALTDGASGRGLSPHPEDPQGDSCFSEG